MGPQTQGKLTGFGLTLRPASSLLESTCNIKSKARLVNNEERVTLELEPGRSSKAARGVMAAPVAVSLSQSTSSFSFERKI